MSFKLKNKELKKIEGQLRNSATMHAKQADKLEKMSPAKLQDGPGGLSPKERVAKAQGREVGEMNRASRFHPDNAGRGVKTAVPMKSPIKGKISPSCKARAKKKFKVYPCAYANGWLVRTYKKRGGKYA